MSLPNFPPKDTPQYNSTQINSTVEFLRIFSIFWESCMFVTPWSINIRLYDVTHRPEYSISKDLDVIIKFATKKYPHIQFKSNQENYGIFKDIFYFLGSWLLPPDPLINPFFGVKNEPKYSKSYNLDATNEFYAPKIPHLQFKSNNPNNGIFEDIFYFLGSWLLPLIH